MFECFKKLNLLLVLLGLLSAGCSSGLDLKFDTVFPKSVKAGETLQVKASVSSFTKEGTTYRFSISHDDTNFVELLQNVRPASVSESNVPLKLSKNVCEKTVKIRVEARNVEKNLVEVKTSPPVMVLRTWCEPTVSSALGAAKSMSFDKNGVVWVATDSTLNRFDGKTWKQFPVMRGEAVKKMPFLTSVWANITEGELWVDRDVGTESLTRLKIEDDHLEVLQEFHSPLLPSASSLPSAVVNSLSKTSDGKHLLVGTRAGLGVIELSTNKVVKKQFDGTFSGWKVNKALQEPNSEKIWLATNSGIIIKENLDSNKSIVLEGRVWGENPTNRNVLDLVFAKSGTAYFGLSQEGVMDLGGFVYGTVQSYPLFTGILDKTSFPVMKDGWHSFLRVTGSLTQMPPDFPPSFDIRKVVLGSDGEVWLATAKGVVRFDQKKKEFTTLAKDSDTSVLAQSLVGAEVNDIVYREAEGEVWILTKAAASGLVKLRPSLL